MRSLGLLTALVLVSCDTGPGSAILDAPPPPDAAPLPDVLPPPDAAPPDASCREQVPVGDLDPGAGHHFPGQGCTYGCHDGANGPDFHFGGTIYVNYAGQAPRPGVTIHVRDAAGREYEVVSQDNGNFWLPTNVGPLTFPLKTWASACPQIEPMELPTPDPGNCNDTGVACHTIDPPFRIRLPLP
jgi:hypothetical protein